MDYGNSDSSTQFASGALGIGLLVGLLIVTIIYIWAAVRIIHRSGYSGWWILITLVPILNVIMYLVFAFKEAPTERELKQLRAQLRGGMDPNYR